MLMAESAKTPTSAPAHGRGGCLQATICWIWLKIAHCSCVALGKQQQPSVRKRCMQASGQGYSCSSC